MLTNNRLDRISRKIPLKHAFKDIRLAVETVESMEVLSTVTRSARDMFGEAWDKGFDDRDISAVIRALTDK